RLVQTHAHLQYHLPVRDLAILDVAAHLGYFEPLQVAQGARSALQRIAHGGVARVGGGSHQLYLLVGVCIHLHSPWTARCNPHRNSRIAAENIPVAAQGIESTLCPPSPCGSRIYSSIVFRPRWA